MLKLGYDDGQVVIEGYQLPESGDSFSEKELAEAYVMASLSHIEEKDSAAAERVKAWINKKELPGGQAVYSTWREGALDLEPGFIPTTPPKKQPKTTRHDGPSALPDAENANGEWELGEPNESKADAERTQQRVLQYDQ